MCDCFHLAFPNWHGPAAGGNRRLRGPEQDTEDDSVCEEPEILEGERPRPQGSSPTEEFPAEKQGGEDIYEPPQKTSKKTRRVGFGSLFDKRSSAKMSDSEEIESAEPGVIVKTVKDVRADGLVVTGGGKEGIFIKEVKPDSLASKHLSVKEGDQILSATVYFDNVSYEDALQILEHAQPYKMEFCLKRKVESALPGDAEMMSPEGNEDGLPEMRGHRKMKKQQDRISWPKFPSFGKGHRKQFKRSHSTSEAEERRKLEMSPPASDTESPLKSPLKSPDGKDKKRKHKMQLKMKMKGQRSKSVEEAQINENELMSDEFVVLENKEVEDILEEKLPEEPVSELVKITQDRDELEVLPKETDLKHQVHLISLDSTLKTTDISVAFLEGSASDRTSAERKSERSEIKINIHKKETSDSGADRKSINIRSMNIVSDEPAFDSISVSPTVRSQVEVERADILESNLGPENVELSMSNVDAFQGLSDVVVVEQSPKPGSEKEQWKEKNILEIESYGIRTRGPLADIAASKTHFDSGLEFVLPGSSEGSLESNIPEPIPDTKQQSFPMPVISQPKLNSHIVSSGEVLDETTLELPKDTNIDSILEKKSKSKFKLPKVDLSGFAISEPIKITKVERKSYLPKREDIEIPGMEDKKSKTSVHAKKTPKTEKIINISNNRGIQSQQTDFNVDDVKEAVSKFPALKLPEGDITGVLVQREITIMEMKADKTPITPRGSPCKVLATSSGSTTKVPSTDTDTAIKVPKVQIPYIDEETSVTTIDFSKSKGDAEKAETGKILITDDTGIEDVKFKLPKREDIEIPGMESLNKSNVQDTEIKIPKDIRLQHSPKLPQTLSITLQDEQTYKQERKGKEKKSKKSKTAKPGFGITKLDIRLPDVRIELPKKDVSTKGDIGEIKEKKVEVAIYKKDSKINVDKVEPLETLETVSAEEWIKQCESSIDASLHKKEPTKFKIPKIKEHFHTDDSVNEIRITQDKFKPENEAVDTTEICFPDTGLKRSIGPAVIPEPSNAEAQFPIAEVMVTASEADSKRTEVKAKSPAFPFPKFGFPKLDIKIPQGKESSTNILSEGSDGHPSDIKVSYVDKDRQTVKVDVKTHDTDTEMQGSKFKLPKFEISFPEVKVPKIILSKKEVDVSVQDREEDISGLSTLDVDTSNEKPAVIDNEMKSVSLDVKTQIFEVERQDSTILKPTFEISHTEIKGPKADINASNAGPTISPVTDGHKPEFEVAAVTGKEKVGVPGDFPSTDHELKVKRPGFSFPKFGFSKSDSKVTDDDVSLPNIDVPEGTLEKTQGDIAMSVGDDGQKDPKKSGSPTKFKLPSITLPKFGSKSTKGTTDISMVATEVKGSEDLKDAELKMSVKMPSVDIKSQGKLSEAESNIPKADECTPIVVTLLDGNADLEIPKTDILASVGVKVQKDESKFSSPTKFKLPSVSLPKFGVDSEKEGLDSADKSADKEKVDMSVNADTTTEDKFKLPKFGISLPEVKGPKTDLSVDSRELGITLQEEKVEMLPSDLEKPTLTAGVKVDIVEIDSKNADVKIKRSGFSFPKFGYSKSESKSHEGVADLPDGDESFPEGSDAEQKDHVGSPTKFKLPLITLPKFGAKSTKETAEISAENIDVKGLEINMPDAELKIKAPEADVGPRNVDSSSVDIQFKAPEISLPDAESKFSSKTVPTEFNKTGDKEDISLNVEVKAQDIQTESGLSKIKLPKFGISLPEVKGPKIDLHGGKKEHDIVPPEGEAEVHAPDLGELDVCAEVKEDQKELDSQGREVKIKRSGFSFPKFGFSKSEAKGPEADMSITDVEVSLAQGNIEIEEPNEDILVGETGKKESTKFGSPTKFKLPSITLPKFGAKSTKEKEDISAVDIDAKGPDISLRDTELKMKASEVDVVTPKVDISLPDANAGVENKIGIKVSVDDTVERDATEHGSSSKFKLPSISLSKFGTTADKETVESTALDVQVKAPEISLPDAELKLSSKTEPAEVEKLDDKADISLNIDVKAQDIQPETGMSKFKFPKFDFSLPEVKGPKIDLHGGKREQDITLPEGEAEVYAPDRGELDVHAKVKEGKKELDSQNLEVKIKRPGFSFPKFGFSKSEAKGPEADMSLGDVEVSLPQGNIEIEEANKDILVGETGKKESTKFGSPTKFKLPSITLPKFGAKSTKEKADISAVDIDAKGPDLSLRDTELKTKASEVDVVTPKVDISLPDANAGVENKIGIKVSVDDTVERDATEHGSSSKFKLPSISLSKFGTTADKETVESTALDVQVKAPEISLPDAELKLSSKTEPAEVKKLDDKEDISLNIDVKTQDIQPETGVSKFKFPKFDFSLPEVKGPKIDLHGGKKGQDITLPEGEAEVYAPDRGELDVHAKVKEGKKELDSQNLEVKIKRPGFSFPKFGFSKSEPKGSEADMSLGNVEVSLPQGNIEVEEANKDILVGETGKKESTKFGSPTKFKLPSITLPKFGAKSTKEKVGISAVEIDTKGTDFLPDTELKMKASEVDVVTPKVDISLPDANAGVENKICIKVSVDDTVERDAAEQGSSSKFKLPSINLSKYGTTADIEAAESSALDVQVKAPEISLPDAELKLSSKTEPAEVKKLDDKEDISLNIDVKAEDIQPETGISMFKFPKFGISLPEVKGPKIDLHKEKKVCDIALPEGDGPDLGELDVQVELKEDQKELNSQGLEVKVQRPGFSFPKFGISKSDGKVPEADLSLPDVDVSLQQANIEIEKPSKDVPVSEIGKKESTKFGSPTKFKLPSITLPKFGAKSTKERADISTVDIDSKGTDLSLPDAELKMKASEVDVGLPKMDISLPDASTDAENKVDIKVSMGETLERDVTKQDSSSKFQLPSISFSKFGTTADKEAADNTAVDVQVKAPEISLPDAELKWSSKTDTAIVKKTDDKADISVNIDVKAQDIQPETGVSKFKFPKFGINLPDVKGPKIDGDKKENEITLPKGEAGVHAPDLGEIDVHAEVKEDQKEQDSKGLEVKIKRPGFSFPKFGFSKSEGKSQEADLSLTDAEISLAQGNIEIEDLKKDTAVSEIDQRETKKFGSPTKFKLPSITLPKLGAKSKKEAVAIPTVDTEAKGTETSLGDKEIQLPAEPTLFDLKGPQGDKDDKCVGVKAQDIQSEGPVSRFKFPKFEINFPDVKGPKVDVSSAKINSDVSLPEGQLEVNLHDAELPDATAELKIDSKSREGKSKLPSFSFPKFGFSKSESKVPETDMGLSNVDLPLSQANVEVERPDAPVAISEGDNVQDKDKFGSPTKFKLPSISLLKIGTKSLKGGDLSSADIQVEGPDMSLPEAEIKLTAKPPNELDKDMKELSFAEMKAQEMRAESELSKFKSPKFGITLAEVEGPKIKVSAIKTDTKICLSEGKEDINLPEQANRPCTKGPDAERVNLPEFRISVPEHKDKEINLTADKTEIEISLPEEKIEVQSVDLGVPVVTAEIKPDQPEVDLKMKKPDFSFPKFGFPKIETKEAELNVSVTSIDVPEGSVDLVGTTTAISESEAKQKKTTKFGSPTKFKLPSITLPKFGTKPTMGIPHVDTDAKRPEIGLQDTELQLSAEPLSTDKKGPDVDVGKETIIVDMETSTVQTEEKESTFKLPKFGISLPEVKGPKMEPSRLKIDPGSSLPKGKVNAHLPDAEVPGAITDIKVDLPEVDSKSREVKSKRPSFSFPKFGFSKSEVKMTKTETTVDVTLQEGSLNLDQTQTDITASTSGTLQGDEIKFGSPTKFKLPSISLPKFGSKAEQEVPDNSADAQVKVPEISLPDAELKLSEKSLPADLKGPHYDKDQASLTVSMKDIQAESEVTKFKLPKVGATLAEVKGKKNKAIKTEFDITLPEGKVEVPPASAEIKAELKETDTHDLEWKTKRPGISFPKFGSSKLENKVPDMSRPSVDVSVVKGKIEKEQPSTDIPESVGDARQKEPTKFSSPTRFKLPSITLPKFSAKSAKGTVDPAADVDVKGSEMCPPDAELKLSAEPLSVDIKGPDFEEAAKTLPLKDTYTEGQESKFRFPKFQISLPEVKGPKIDLKSDKKELDMTIPESQNNLEAKAEAEIKDTFPQPSEEVAKKEEVDKGSPGRFKLPTIKMGKITISKTKSQEGDDESVSDQKETKYTEDAHRTEKHKMTMLTLGDVLRGFDVEFNVPTLEETETARKDVSMKQKYETEVKEGASTENIAQAQTEQKYEEEKPQAKAEKSGWFKFPKFSSPIKTAKVDEKETSEPPKKAEDNLMMDMKEKESEKSSTKEIEEDIVSPTLSIRSSDAFADVSSAQTTEQFGLSMDSPTKVKAKYFEPTTTVEVSDLHGDLITSTARTHLISMEPHQPEKVNIPFSSETSSSSLDTLKQMSGQIHVIVSNIQTVPGTQHAAILTSVGAQRSQTLPPEELAKKSEIVLSAEEIIVQKEEHILVEKHVVKEMFSDDNQRVLVTQRIQVFEGASDDTASSIQKLKDTVHTEKMRFFEDAEPNTSTMSTEISLRHVDSSTDENEGK